MSENEEEEQEWKNVLHHTIKSICGETKETYDVTFDFDFVATLTELTFRQIGSFAEDLELFARHGKRNVINIDDIKLLVRKSPALMDFIQEKFLENAKNKEKENQSKKKKAIAVPETNDADIVLKNAENTEKENQSKKNSIVVPETIDANIVPSTSAPKGTKKKKRGKK